MKNIVKILSIILLLTFIIGCSKVADTDLTDTVDETDAEEKQTEVKESVVVKTEPAEPVETKEKEVVEQTEVKTDTAPAETPVQEPQETPQKTTELQILLSKIDTKVRNFKYNFGEPPFNTETNEYKVQLKNEKGEEDPLIRIELYKYDEHPLIEGRWDTAFLNPTDKTAKLYCLGRTYCQTKEVDKRNETQEADYDEYKTMTPYDWAQIIPKEAKLISKELMNGRTVTRFEYMGEDGLKYNVWIDNTYGLPMQVEREGLEGKKMKYIYRELSLNSVNAEEFEYPF